MISPLFIIGQTATGKTAYATKIARNLNGQLINCDSRQIYKHLHIVTGKNDNPSDIPIDMVDLVDPKDKYSAYEYAVTTYELINSVIRRGKVPIVVGGTGLYAYALLHYSPFTEKETKKRKNQTSYVIDSKNVLSDMDAYTLKLTLQKMNRETYELMNASDRNNPRRLVSAICELKRGGRGFLHRHAPDTIFNIYHPNIQIFIHEDSQLITDRISKRVQERLKRGAIEEAQKLREMGYKKEDPGLRTIGYPQLFQYIDQCIDEETLISQWTRKEKQYAKRQKTYMNKYFPTAHLSLV